MKTYKFIRSGRDWYIDLPEFIEQGGSIGDLQMVDGADQMLDMMAGKTDSVILSVSTVYFDGADKISLMSKCDPDLGGGYYEMKYYNGAEINRTMWLCQVTEFVFGDIPPEIFVRKMEGDDSSLSS